MTKNAPGKFRALGNMGDILGRSGNMEEAVRMYARQLALARNTGDRSLEAAAYGALGRANRTLGFFDKALGYHTQVKYFTCLFIFYPSNIFVSKKIQGFT